MKYNVIDGTDIINCDRIKDIPKDYDGLIAVPITIVQYDGFEIEDINNTPKIGGGTYSNA